MFPVKQSTGLAMVAFAHDANGDAITGLVNGDFTKRISKNGAAFGALTITITELENGWYALPLSSSHTDTLGILTVTLTASGMKQVNLQFRVDARLPDDLAWPTVTGRSLDVSATGEAGLDWANIGSPTTAQALSGTTVASVSALGTGAIAAASFAAGAIDATAIADDAIGSGELAASAITEIQSAVSAGSIASVVGTVGSVTGSVGSVASGGITTASFAAGAINAAAIASDAITAAKIATDAIDADALAANAVSEIQASIAAGSVGSVVGDVGGNVVGSVGSLATQAKADVNAEVVDVFAVDTYPEPSIVPAATCSLKDKIAWFFTQSRNRITQTSSTTVLRSDSDTATIASAAVSDNGTVFAREKWS